jgi:hypothetical protein
MKRVSPKDLVKPSRPILVNLNGMTRQQMKRALLEALQARGFNLSSNKGDL